MTNTVNDYLERLDAALAHVPYATAREIREGVEEELRSLDAAAADERMRELGEPEHIATAAAGESAAAAPAPAPAAAPRGTGSPNYVVITALAVGIGAFVVPLLGWFAGIALLWSSAVWRTWEKVLATAAPLLGTGLFLLASWISASVEQQARAAATGGGDFHAPSMSEYGASNPFIPATYDIAWTGAFGIGAVNLAVGVWLLIVGLRRSLPAPQPRSGGAGSSATAAGVIGTVLIAFGALLALVPAVLFARPIMVLPGAVLLLIGGGVLLVRGLRR